MARQQFPNTLPNKTVASSGTPEALTATSTLVTSFLVQALNTNTDFVYIGDSASQTMALAPGRSVRIEGDKLDLGTQAYVDIANFYCKVNVNGNGVSITALQRF